MWGRTGCSNITDKCLTGDCCRGLKCYNMDPSPPVTTAYFSLDSNGADIYFIALNNGYNLPLSVSWLKYGLVRPRIRRIIISANFVCFRLNQSLSIALIRICLAKKLSAILVWKRIVHRIWNWRRSAVLLDAHHYV